MKNQHMLVNLIIFVVSYFSGFMINADPFENCPSKAFLFQGNNVQIFDVNLLTGSYSLIQDDVGMDGNVNAAGFRFADRYIYAFNTSSLKVVRLNKTFQATELSVSGLPADTKFFVGDVVDNYYYIYRKNVGFYRINLDSSLPDYLHAERLASADVSLTLTDFAFHPGDNQLYAVDNKTGILYRISPDDGVATVLGDTGETGTFGAGYFDVNGYYYVSRNSDGKIFRIDLSDVDSPQTTALFFAQGPYSNQNDGARCANAPMAFDNIDWGDAPASYGTLLVDNGARHELKSGLYMGLSDADGESDGLPYAVNDDSSNRDDEDGVGFVTPLEIGLDGLLQITVSGSGYLNAWIDWNGDGDFSDNSEKVFSAVPLVTGTHTLTYRVPADASPGTSWSRFRFSSSPDLVSVGGAPDGEVEDYPVSINESGVSYRYYPSQGGWVTLAYEDVWPKLGDYDMNDVVLNYRIVELIKEDKIIRIDIYGQLVAMGAIYHNGFAVHLENVSRENVDSQRLRTLYNNELVSFDTLEEGQSEAVIKVSDDLWQHVNSSCRFYRSVTDCKEGIEFSFELSVNFNTPVALESMPSPPYNPFIFASPYWGRGEVFDVTPGRGLEIHLVDKPPTDLADISLFGLVDDASNLEQAQYYKTSTHLPWAIEIGTDWHHPAERVEIREAYPGFESWIESGGNNNEDWYLPVNANMEKVYQ